ncbi:MAG: hypothetical protein ACD_75C01826G0002 [uncultured bacterium]|nr:MAG: hypothetical protein ACD_75C01826G0002 [uncultured bacterium]
MRCRLVKKSTRIRKEEIVQAALKVVGSRGVRALTTAAIADAAGMSEANIYRHFSGKDEILSALVEFIGSAVMGKAAAIAGGSRKPLEKLEAIFSSHISLMSEHPGIPRFVFSDDIHLGHRNLADSLALRIGNYIETITGVIAAGIAEGELKQDLSPRETALTLLGMIQFTALRWTISNASFEIGPEAEKLWGNFTRLVR